MFEETHPEDRARSGALADGRFLAAVVEHAAVVLLAERCKSSHGGGKRVYCISFDETWMFV